MVFFLQPHEEGEQKRGQARLMKRALRKNLRKIFYLVHFLALRKVKLKGGRKSFSSSAIYSRYIRTDGKKGYEEETGEENMQQT